MTNNLLNLKKDLKSFAKKCKDFKYTDSALLTFLLNGMLISTGEMFAETVTKSQINNQVSQINTSINQMRTDFKHARAENNKLIRDTNLELTQLMEQGDHVTKSPWSNWQFGINDFYNDWHGTYKGKGDKKASYVFERDKSLVNRSSYPGRIETKYGATTLGLVREPNAAMDVSAALTPRNINKFAPKFTLLGAGGGFPDFVARVVKAPDAPSVITPTTPRTLELSFSAGGANPASGRYSYWMGNKGDISGTSVSSGEILKKYTSISTANVYNGLFSGTIQTKDFNGENVITPYSLFDGDNSPKNNYTNTETSRNLFFDTLTDTPYSHFGSNAKISVITPNNVFVNNSSHRGTVINLETEGVTGKSFDDLVTAGTINTTQKGRIDTYVTRTGFKRGNGEGGGTKSQLYYSNDGIVEIGGFETRYIHTTVDGGNERLNIIENNKDIIGINYSDGDTTTSNNIIFFHSPDLGGRNNYQHIYANSNTGKIELYGKSGAVMLYTAAKDITSKPRLSQGDVSFINDGEINLYGVENTGIAINTDAYGKVTKDTSFILSKPINIYGDDGVGLYNGNSGDGTRNSKNIARFVIGNKSQASIPSYVSSNSLLSGSYSANSSASKVGYNNKYTEGVIGIYQDVNDTLKSALPELTMEAFTRKSVGIYTKSGNVDIDHGTVAANKGKISILGGEENVGLYASGGGISFKGDIEMGGSASTLTDAITKGFKNTAVYATNGFKVKIEGNVKTNKNSTLTDSTVVYADKKSEVTLNGENLIELETSNKNVTGSTGNNTGIFADDATVIFGDNNGSSATPTGTTTGSSASGSSIKITGDDRKLGTALYAKNGGTINAIGDSLPKGLKITVKDGASAIASVGKNSANNPSNISIKYSTIDYDGEGFALYTDTDGKINADNSKVKLSGKAVGFGIKGTSSGGYTSNVSLSNSNFEIASDDVILMNVINPNSLMLSNFVSTLSAASGLNASNITTNGPGAGDNYKLAVVEGLNNGKSFTFDNDLDKNLAVNSSTSSTNDYKYVRNFLIQRSILNVNSDVKAVLNSADANTVKGVASGAPVIGLDISSSSGAASNTETGINVNGKTITADRTDSGNGAIGLYTNFGKININNGTLNVETDTTNTVNDQAVGVYAVNGSEVNNNGGNINVGGKNSIGILGLAYREDSAGTVIGNEFGSANEGKATIYNNGNITMDGKEAKGVFIKNNGTSSVADNVANNLSNGVITMSGADSVGMYADKATLNNHGKIDLQAGTNGKIGMYGINGSDITNHSDGQIIVGDSTISAATDVPNIGMYTSESNLLKNYGTIDIKENSYGIYGENIQAFGTSKIKVGKNGVGIFAKGTSGTGTVTLDAGSEITTSASAKDKEAVGVFTAGTNPVNINDNGSKMDLKDWTFGYVIKAPGTLTTNGSSTVTLDNEAVYAYSDNDSSVINNYAPIKATGDRNYGIYSSGTVDNYGNMDLKSGNGVGNIGIYSTKGVATNWATIDTGKTNKTTKSYGIGMATGYYDGAVSRNQGTVINKGTINVTEDNSIGMYAVGAGSKAINDHGATINLSGKNTIGMYIDQGAEGENYGTIVGNGDSIKGVVAANQGKFKNYGTIQITGNRGIGIYTDKGVVSADGVDGTGASNTGSFKAVYESSPTDEKVEGGVTIKVPPKATPVTVTINGKAVEITGVDTNATPSSVNATEATVTSPSGVTVLDLAKSGFLNFESNPSATSIGMYVDTSGIKYTNPIQGLSNLAGLTDINMYFGTEAARYTNARAIELGDNIIKPYNDALATVVSTGTVLNTNSSSLTWLAIPTKSSVTGLYDKVYLVKVPYTDFVSAKDPNTYNFLDGLEQRYGVEGLGTREKELFNKLNDLGKGEQHIFTQAVDEMKGHQYANIQQRTNATGNALDKEFSYLRNEWRNPTKQNNKIKAFGLRDEYNTDTAGIIDYKSNAYGVAYVHEDEKVRMGNSSGWYAGAVTNRFRFKDIGKSREQQTMLKLGVFKTMSPKGDHNGALQWTIGGDVFAGINNMKRKFWVVDDTFEAKSTYHTYGAALKNELGYDIRMSERTHLRPYGALKMEYGRFNDVKEDSGQMRLEVKGNDYFSVKPEAGLEFKYVQPLAVRTNLTVGLTAAYENELGKLQNGNQARVRYTTAGWYNLEKEKEDRRGNGKFDLNIGIDNTRFGVTVNAGYDTKGSNIRGGIGFRAIY